MSVFNDGVERIQPTPVIDWICWHPELATAGLGILLLVGFLWALRAVTHLKF